jgi:hypothetical protein
VALHPNIIQSLADGLSCLSLGAPLRSCVLCVFFFVREYIEDRVSYVS